MRAEISLSAARALALHAQGLTTPNGAEAPPSLDSLYNLVQRLGCVQIDTIHVVRRTHYLVPWSRLGSYDPADLDRLAYGAAERRLFEGWQRCASLIPLEDYRYQMPHQRKLREEPTDWYMRWLTNLANPELVPAVLERVRQEGGLRASDFDAMGHKGGTWWDWKPAKVALEYLYAWGALMISGREKFQRVYDLTERVLPAWVDNTEPSPDERDRYWLAQGVRCLGICTPGQGGDYAYRKRPAVKTSLDGLLRDGTLLPVSASLVNGKTVPMLVHREHLPALEQALDGALVPARTTFLSPFDSLFWGRALDGQLWGFRNTLEAYKPEPKRTWGYFNVSILHKERFAGRFDPKLERQNGTLRLKGLWLEQGVEPDEELARDMAVAMRDFMKFHGAHDLVIERSQPQEFAGRLLAAM